MTTRKLYRQDLGAACGFIIKCLILIIIINAFAGCAGLNVKSSFNEELRQRVQDFWNARVAGDLVTCYKYEEEGKLSKVSLTDYIKSKGNLIYKSAKVQSVSIINPKEARVSVELEYVLPAFGTSRSMKSTVIEKWVNIGGNWFHHAEEPFKK